MFALPWFVLRLTFYTSGLAPEQSALHLLSHLYAQKSFSVWKDHADWFRETVSSTFTTLPSRLPVTERRQSFLALYKALEPRFSLYRHLVVLETTHRNLFPFIEPRVLQDARGLTCDPMPPPTAVTKYDPEYFSNVDDLQSFTARRSRRDRALDERRLAQMIPDANFRQQLQGFFDANPAFGQRFPGGILQFAQAIAQLPPDVLDDMMMAEAMGGGGIGFGGVGDGNGEMPGGIGLDMNDLEEQGQVPEANFGEVDEDAHEAHGGGEHDEHEDEDDDEDEEDYSVSRLPCLVLGEYF